MADVSGVKAQTLARMALASGGERLASAAIMREWQNLAGQPFLDEIRDAVGGHMFTGTNTGATFVYDPVTRKYAVTVTGGGGGAGALGGLSDVADSPAYTAGFTLRADGAQFVSARLGYADLSGLPTLGTMAAEAAANYVLASDTRLTNARTPTAHAASHSGGSTDPISLQNLGGAVTAGQVGANIVSPAKMTQVAQGVTLLRTTAATGDLENFATHADGRALMSSSYATDRTNMEVPFRGASGNHVTNLWRGTQAQYDAIGTKDATTIYFVTA